MAKKNPPYQGFEQGPIRPPSEAHSLLLRLTRNCPWNRCTFCYIYKHEKFSIRPVEDVKKDIDTIHRHLGSIAKLADSSGSIYREDISQLAGSIPPDEIEAFNATLNWFACGMESIFLQDANSLVMKPEYLVEILEHLKCKFDWVKRITSYARSHSLARISDENLLRIKEGGLNRIHVGLETGADVLLNLIQKGCTKEMHITAGNKVKKAGMELSEYVMPGLGGKQLSEIHAIETADTLNQIDPHFIRLRTTTIPANYQLFADESEHQYEKMKDLEIVDEIRLFVDKLEGINSTFKSDHMMNLLQTLEGTFPDDKENMLTMIDRFQDRPQEEKMLFQIGRRFGFMLQPSDLEKSHLRDRAQQVCYQFNITPETVDKVIEQNVQRMI